jgi:virginiamycin B lyase
MNTTQAASTFAVAFAVVFATSCSAPPAPVPRSPTSTAAAGATGSANGAVVAARKLAHPYAVATGEGSVWVTEYDAGNLVRIDPQSNRVVARMNLGGKAGNFVLDAGSAWVTVRAGDGSDSVKRVDTASGDIGSIPLGTSAVPIGIALGAGSLWVAEQDRAAVVRIDPATDAVTSTIPVGFGPYGIVVAGGAVWTANRFAATVSRIDVATLYVSTITTGHRPSGVIAFGEGSIWAGNDDGVLSRIDPATGQVRASLEIGSPDWPSMAVAGGTVWIAAPLDNEIARVDAQTGNVVSIVHTGSKPQGIALDGAVLWVANYDDGTLVKLAR